MSARGGRPDRSGERGDGAQAAHGGSGAGVPADRADAISGAHGARSPAGGRRSSGLLGFLRRRDEVPHAALLRARKPLRFGAVFLVVLAVAIYFGFTKSLPFSHGFRLNAVFPTALDIAPGSPVRIAGVPVGQVTGFKRVGSAGEVIMEISKAGLPVHEDATLKIRPRLFLEGNWFVELNPGSPSSPVVSSGHTIPLAQTADPVQLDQVLDALNSETRANLQTVLIEYGKALAVSPTPKQNAESEPGAKGLNGAQALRKAAEPAPVALRDAAIVAQALAGTHREDLPTLVAEARRLAAALDAHPRALGELIVNFNAFLKEFADQSAALRVAVARLPGALGSATHAFVALDAAIPPISSFSKALIPGVEATPATISAMLPWIAQVQGLLGPSELGGIARSLREGAPSFARLTSGQVPFYQQNDLFSRCSTDVLIPAGNAKLQDGANTSGESDFHELMYSLVGLNSIGQGFTGNGLSGLRTIVGSGGETLRSGPASVVGQSTAAGQNLVARAPLAPLGTSPAFSGKEPPYRPLVPCYKQALPEFNGPLSRGPADGSGG